LAVFIAVPYSCIAAQTAGEPPAPAAASLPTASGADFVSNLQGNERADCPKEDANSELLYMYVLNRYSRAVNSAPVVSWARLQFEGVFARRNHAERNRRSAHLSGMIFRGKPERQARIVNFGFSAPEIRLQSALYAQVIQLKLDLLNVSREVTADILKTNAKSGDFTADT
jgi:hypothetical protein